MKSNWRVKIHLIEHLLCATQLNCDQNGQWANSEPSIAKSDWRSELNDGPYKVMDRSMVIVILSIQGWDRLGKKSIVAKYDSCLFTSFQFNVQISTHAWKHAGTHMVTMRNHVTLRDAAHAHVDVGKFQTSRLVGIELNTLRCGLLVLCVSLSTCCWSVTLFDPDLLITE